MDSALCEEEVASRLNASTVLAGAEHGSSTGRQLAPVLAG